MQFLLRLVDGQGGKPATRPGGSRLVSGPIRPRVSHSPPGLCKRWANGRRPIGEEQAQRQGQEVYESEGRQADKAPGTEWSREGQRSRLVTTCAPAPTAPCPSLGRPGTAKVTSGNTSHLTGRATGHQGHLDNLRIRSTCLEARGWKKRPDIETSVSQLSSLFPSGKGQ